MSIKDFMASHHQGCDENYIKAEGLVSEEKYQEAESIFKLAYDDFMLHFEREENVLFPEFEALTGMVDGPTKIMRMEHVRMKQTLNSLNDFLKNKDKDNFLGLSESFMILVGQHNMKEEQMLYPMADRAFAEKSSDIVEKIKQYKETLP